MRDETKEHPVFHDSERAGLLAICTALVCSSGRTVNEGFNTAQQILVKVEEVEGIRIKGAEEERRKHEEDRLG